MRWTPIKLAFDGNIPELNSNKKAKQYRWSVCFNFCFTFFLFSVVVMVVVVVSQQSCRNGDDERSNNEERSVRSDKTTKSQS